MSYTHGKGEIIPGLESQLTGMKAGGEKKFTVKPDDGYGPVDPRAFQEVPKDKLPAAALKVGTMLMAQGPQGQTVPVRVHEIKEKTVIMDSTTRWREKLCLSKLKSSTSRRRQNSRSSSSTLAKFDIYRDVAGVILTATMFREAPR